jgi:YcxB-like protein
MPRPYAESSASGIAYTFTFGDFLATRRALAWNGVFGHHTYWIRYVIFAVIMVACWWVPVRHDLKPYALSDSHIVLLTFAAVLALMIFAWTLDLLFTRLAYGRLAIAGAEVSLTFEADGVHYKMPSYSGVLSWSGIHRALTMPGHLFLFISKSEAVVLPRRAFPSDGAFGETLQHVQTKIGAEAVS